MIDPLLARQRMLDELRKWLVSGRPMPSVRALAETLDMPKTQAREVLRALEAAGDVRIRRAAGGARRWVTRVRDTLSRTPRRALISPDRRVDRAVRKGDAWPAGARFDDDAAAAADQLVFRRLPSVGGAQSLTGSAAAWVAEG